MGEPEIVVEPDHGVMERSLALFPGWQMGTQKARRTVERRDFLGVIARADRAPLGEVELDVLTWLSARWYEQGRAESGRVTFTLYELGSALYGRQKLGGHNNQIIREALENLHAAVITLSGVNVLTGEFERSFKSKVHILSTVVISEQLQMIEGSDGAGAGGLRGSTMEVRLEDWLVAQLEGQAALRLDWALQRRLTGLAKRLWVYLAAEDARFELCDSDVEDLVVPLTNDTFGALGIECARERDNRAALKRAATRMLAEDPRYVEAELVPPEGRSVTWKLRVVRRYAPQPRAVDLVSA